MTKAKSFATAAESIAWARRASKMIHPSKPWQPLRLMTDAARLPTHKEAAEMQHWENDTYLVAAFRFRDGWPLNGGPWMKLGISCHDGQPRHDWREFQLIKNQLAGPEWEALELFPAESRLVDPSNYFYLFCAPAIPVGLYDGRRVLSPEQCLAPQRAWAAGDQPADCNTRSEEMNRIAHFTP